MIGRRKVRGKDESVTDGRTALKVADQRRNVGKRLDVGSWQRRSRIRQHQHRAADQCGAYGSDNRASDR